MKSKVNLHIHTKYSDGFKTVPEIISELKYAGIEYFAITDLDTVDGNFEATEYARKYKMKYSNGIELSCRFLHEEIGFDDLCGCHILGLGIKVDEIQKRLKIQNENEGIKIRKLHDLLVSDGYKLEPINAIPSLKNIINDLITKGYATNKNDCKTKILCTNAYRQYAVNLNMDVQTAIRTIKECGGIAIWAHPFKAPGFGRKEELNKERISKMLDLLCEYGLDGIEAYYQHRRFTDYTAEQIRFLESIADSKKMFKSIGTDYHGEKDEISFDVEGITPDDTIIAYLESRMENNSALL